jgi:general secretion pathway protein I
MPDVGDTETECEQAGHAYRVKLVVRPTPNSNFRRVDAGVLDGDTPILSLSTVVGRN